MQAVEVAALAAQERMAFKLQRHPHRHAVRRQRTVLQHGTVQAFDRKVHGAGFNLGHATRKRSGGELAVRLVPGAQYRRLFVGVTEMEDLEVCGGCGWLHG